MTQMGVRQSCGAAAADISTENQILNRVIDLLEAIDAKTK